MQANPLTERRTTSKLKGRKLYVIRNKRGVGGLTTVKPVRRKQDKTFVQDGDLFAVVFFPAIDGVGKAQIWKHTLVETLSSTPKVAIAKFMDNIASGEIWSRYAEAGWKVRRIKVVDLGEPE